MSMCRVCLADITWAVLLDGTKVPLDNHHSEPKGPHRYRYTGHGTPPTIEKVPDEFEVPAMMDHREICQKPRVM